MSRIEKEAPRSGGGAAARRLALLQAREEAFSEEGVERAPSRSRSRQRPRSSPSPTPRGAAEDSEEVKKLQEKLATANERIGQLEAGSAGESTNDADKLKQQLADAEQLAKQQQTTIQQLEEKLSSCTAELAKKNTDLMQAQQATLQTQESLQQTQQSLKQLKQSPPKKAKKKVKMKGGVTLSVAALDTDGDGKISLAEFVAGGGTEEQFKALDTDGSGQIDEAELKANEALPDEPVAAAAAAAADALFAPAAAESAASMMSEQEVQEEYKRLHKKFTQAMMCGKKYDWTPRKCVEVGTKIEAEITAQGNTDEATFPKLALGIVMDEIKAELQKQRKQDFAMKKILYVMKKNESGGLLISSLSNWSQKLSKKK